MDREKTLDWLAAVSTQAITEAENGNPGLLNTITAKSKAVAYYVNNVGTRQVVSPEQYARQFPAYMDEADRLRREYEAIETTEGNDQRITALEGELKSLRTELKKGLKSLKDDLLEAVQDAANESETEEEPATDETDTEDESGEDEGDDE